MGLNCHRKEWEQSDKQTGDFDLVRKCFLETILHGTLQNDSRLWEVDIFETGVQLQEEGSKDCPAKNTADRLSTTRLVCIACKTVLQSVESWLH